MPSHSILEPGTIRAHTAPVLPRFAMLCAGLACLLAFTLAGDFDRQDGTAATAAVEIEGSGSEPGASDELEESSSRQSHRRQRPRESERAVRPAFVAPPIRSVDPSPQRSPIRRVVEGRTGRDLLILHRCLLI